MIPNNTEDALEQGWVMVCVTPTPLHPPQVLEAILKHFAQVQREVNFTYTGARLDDVQKAVWGKGFQWSTDSLELLMLVYDTKGNEVLKRVIKHLIGSRYPGMGIKTGSDRRAKARRRKEREVLKP